MKPHGFFSRFTFSRASAIKNALAGFAVSILGYGAYQVAVPVWKEFSTSFAYREFKTYGVLGTYQRRFFSSLSRLGELESMDRENRELNQRVAFLEKQYEIERNRNDTVEMKNITEELSDRIRDEAGTELARVLAAIPYQVPTHLLPHQQYALALGYFRKQEYEQSAVLFHYLLNLKEDTSYQRTDVELLSGITWYHLKNYKLARHFLRKVEKNANRTTSVYRQSIVWEAILAKAEGHPQESQRYLTSVLAQFPHALESAWINGHESQPTREVAGKEVEHE